MRVESLFLNENKFAVLTVCWQYSGFLLDIYDINVCGLLNHISSCFSFYFHFYVITCLKLHCIIFDSKKKESCLLCQSTFSIPDCFLGLKASPYVEMWWSKHSMLGDVAGVNYKQDICINWMPHPENQFKQLHKISLNMHNFSCVNIDITKFLNR